ncbi:MAG: signal recognition particle-docking protein FtsY [Candidatus Lokiarchaeota archaeon]|nr:signal recognition particle-docking protein FtsY [Candidatus Lokiarchaeota archaeon]MBD3199933.1 signal recognition particle-docking protein FtsY [Candidatus Lokiarchaeota archaeon]
MLDKLKSAFSTFVKKTLTEEKLEDTISDLNLLLISNDVAMETADEICEKIVESFKDEEVGLLSSTQKLLYETLEGIITDLLVPKSDINLIERIQESQTENSPYVMVFVGVNGTGKTTTMAKIAYYLKNEGISVVAAAADTFRAGAIEQLSHHMNNVGVKVIKNQYKSDPASVAYDAIEHAKAKDIDVVLIDTAGRQVTDKNLMKEIEKICRIAQPDLKIFIGDSLAGNDALFQAQEFNKYIGIDANILTKLDADSKGGAALSIANETKKPIIFIGIGQGYDDLEPFDPEVFISNILGEE